MSRAKVLRRGRIKVDARKAVAKLRDHLLLDPDTWPLEVVRVAAMGGATSVLVEHDADDLRISWDGDPPREDALGRLLDFALEGSRDPETRRLRLFGIAVNASLSTRPSRVEVLARASGDEAVRVRFDPSMHDDTEDPAGEGPAAKGPQVVRVPARALGKHATQVWLRKGFGWGTFLRFATGRVLREVTLLGQATSHATLPVRFDPPLASGPTAAVALRMDLEPHGCPGAVLEVKCDGGASPPRATFLEHGVRLAEIGVPPSEALRTEGSGVHLPIDLRFDGPSWPTNASRSQIDEREARRALAGALAALPAAVRALEAVRTSTPTDVAGLLSITTDPAEAERALSAFACCAAASEDDGPLGFVLELGLGRDAVGRPMRGADLVALVRRAAESAGSERLHVHRGREALPMEFAPFADDVAWLRGHPLDALLAAVNLRDFAEVHDEVAQGIRRRATLHALPPGPPTVPAGNRELFRVQFEEREGALAGLHGEIVLHLRPREQPLLRLFLDERPFASVHPEALLPIDAAIAWPGRLRATLRHDAIASDGTLEAATRAVLDRAARELASRADRLGAEDAPEEAKSLARAALASSAEARSGGLARAAVWPTVSGVHATLHELAEAVHDGALVFVQHRPDGPREAPDGRVVPVLDAVDAVRLGAALEIAIELVPYGPALESSPDARRAKVEEAHRRLLFRELDAQGLDEAISLPFDRGSSRGLAATAREGLLVRTHCGVPLTRQPIPGAPVVIVVEEDAIVPTPAWDGVRSPAVPGQVPGTTQKAGSSLLAGVLGELAKQVSARGHDLSAGSPESPDVDAPDERTLVPRVAPGSPRFAREWSLAALSLARKAGKNQPRWTKPLLDVPLVTMLDEEGRPTDVTLAEVTKRHGSGPAPFLRKLPEGLLTLSWWPLLVLRRDLQGPLEAALGFSLEDGERDLPKRKEIARIELARRALLARPPLPLAAPLVGALPASPTVSAEGSPAEVAKRGVAALVALRVPGAGPVRCSLRYASRFVADVELDGVPPFVVVAVDVASATALDRWSTLSASGRAAATAAALSGCRALARALLEASEGLRFAESPLAWPGARELLVALLPTASDLGVQLRTSTVRLATALGGEVTLAAAAGSDRPIPVARRTFPDELSKVVAEPPVLLTFEDPALEALLLALGPSLDDVTRALDLAANPDARVAAKLDGVPPHPALRASLASLGVQSLEGELELSPEATSTIKIHLHDGSVRTLAPDLPFSVRGVARPLRIDTRPRASREMAEALASAALELLRSLAPDLDELPEIARAAVARTVLAAAARGEKARKVLMRARAFRDVTGQRHAMADLLDQKMRVTTDPPPYPASAGPQKDGLPAFWLDAGALAALKRLEIRIVDVTKELKLDLEAEARANAPQVRAVVAPSARARSLAVATLSGERSGEVALLPGGAVDLAGIQVLKDLRPLCQLPAPEGWPVAATIEDARLTTNRRHDGLAPAQQGAALTEEVAARRTELMRGLVAAQPAHALGFLDVDRSLRGLAFLGRLWLLTDADEGAGRLRVRWGGAGAFESHTVTASSAARVDPAYPAVFPVGGDLFVVPRSPRDVLDSGATLTMSRLVAESIPALVRASTFPEDRARARSVWNAALLGAAVGTGPHRDAEGHSRPGTSVMGEIRRRGCLWVTRHAGLAAGEFPDEAPAFVLLDDGTSPLLELLAERAPSLLREVGGVGIGTSGSPAARGGKKKKGRKDRKEKAPPAASPPRRSPDGAATPPRPSPRPPEAAPPELPEREDGDVQATVTGGTSWLSRVGGALSDAVRGGPRVVLGDDHPLRVALVDAARLAGLAKAPAVVAVPRGRPVRWDEASGELLVTMEHPAVKALLERGELVALAATAVGELNRARDVVSDAEEARVVADLLAARADPP